MVQGVCNVGGTGPIQQQDNDSTLVLDDLATGIMQKGSAIPKPVQEARPEDEQSEKFNYTNDNSMENMQPRSSVASLISMIQPDQEQSMVKELKPMPNAFQGRDGLNDSYLGDNDDGDVTQKGSYEYQQKLKLDDLKIRA